MKFREVAANADFSGQFSKILAGGNKRRPTILSFYNFWKYYPVKIVERDSCAVTHIFRQFSDAGDFKG